MTASENFGVKVVLRFAEGGRYFKAGARGETFRNVTEIHMGYNRPASAKKSIAFESDIHDAGTMYDIDEIAEFETSLETVKGREYYGEILWQLNLKSETNS